MIVGIGYNIIDTAAGEGYIVPQLVMVDSYNIKTNIKVTDV